MTATLSLAAVVKTYDATHESILDPAGRTLTSWLAAGLWLIAIGNFLSFPPLPSVIDGATAGGFTKVAYNAATMLGLGAILVFFDRISAASPGRARTSTRVTMSIATAVVIALALLMIATPAADRGNSILKPGGGQSAVLGFYIVGGLWFVWGYLRAGLSASRFVRVSNGILAAASSLIALGFFLAGVTSAGRMAITLSSAELSDHSTLGPLNEINFSINSLGEILASIGLCVLGALRALDYRRRRRLHRRLRPLWDRLRTSFPEVRLATPPVSSMSAGSGHSHPRSARGRNNVVGYERCLIEVWDGLMRLSPPLNDAVSGRNTATVTAREVAAVVEFATASDPPLGSGEATPASPELLEVLTDGEPDRGLETGAEFLATISQALGRTSAEPAIVTASEQETPPR
jgi:hypothetical protein